MPLTAQTALTPSAWLNGAAIGTNEEREQHILSVADSDEPVVATTDWSDEEVLPFTASTQRKKSGFLGFMRFTMMVSVILFVLKTGYESLQKAVIAHQGTDLKDKKCALPI